MADTGWLFPGTVTVLTDHNYAWSNPDNIKVDDTNVASSVLKKSGSYSHTIIAHNFGASISSGATIDGIEAIINRRDNVGGSTGTGTGTKDIGLYYYNSSTAQGSNMSSLSNWPLALENASYGGATNKWGGTPTRTLVVSSDFGIGIWVGAGGNNVTAYINYIKVKIYYTESAGGNIEMVKVGGVWKTITNTMIKVNGVWKNVTSNKIFINDTWKS